MSILTNDGICQQYTLIATHRKSGEKTICTYAAKGAILTTNYFDLVEYANGCMHRFGDEFIYSLAWVNEINKNNGRDS